MRAARASLHMWEEPPISGKNGSGAIFFSGCTLQCCYCQNYKISANQFGQEISSDSLASVMLRLQRQGAHNINLVTPTQFVPQIIAALEQVRDALHIPVVYNSSGYENVETIEALCGYVDVYLPDVKYRSAERAQRYSHAADYFEKASAAVVAMQRQVGPVVLTREGLMKRGVLIRHLVLPGGYRDSIDLLGWIYHTFGTEGVHVSLMRQYTPCYQSSRYPEIDRRLTTFEYEKVAQCAAELGLKGYSQQKEAASTDFIPRFDLSGLQADNKR